MMNDAFAALQRMKASRVAQVSGVFAAPARASSMPSSPQLALVPPIPVLGAVEALARRAEAGKDVTTEARRIASLPKWEYADLLARCQPGGDLDYTERFRVPGGTMTLKPIQNLALHWIEQKKGLVGPLAVGSGKTLLSLLAAPVMGAQRPVLMIPPALQLPLHHEIARLKKHFRIPLNLYIIPYSQLSVAKSTDLLEQLKPDLIIADEAHSIRSPDAARTKRVLRYFRQFPQTRFIALSGTLTAKELKDYAHLCELALRDGSPVPLTEGDLLAWGNCIDANGTPQEKDWSLFAAFHDVRHLPHEARRDAARDAFRERFNSVPGVVATREASVSCSLNLFERSIATPTEVVHALMELHKTWTRPDGEEMDSALSLWRLGMQMSQGFYLRWVWPEGKVDHEWMEARSSWHREVRYVLQRNLGGMDSPLLVWNAVQRGQLDHPSIVRAFDAWRGQKHKPPPPTETVWISDYLVRDALAWHREHPKGIIWHSDLATENALRAAGVPTYGAGETPPLEGGRGGLALSIRVHGTGLNLQYAHHENLILSFPSSGKTMEQLLGRTHRQGQDADEVACWYYSHTDAARDAFRNARESARYIEQTQGSPQKLCYATYA